MQDFVEKYIREQEAALVAKVKDAGTDGSVAGAEARERDARLIRLGMCEKQYNPATTYSAEYPYQEYKSGKYYRLVPFTVTDEEYEAICRYDNSPIALKPATATDRMLGKSYKGLRRLAVFSLVFGVLVSILGGVLLYFADSQYLLISALIAVLGSVFSYIFAVHFFATAKTLDRVEYLLADRELTKQ